MPTKRRAAYGSGTIRQRKDGTWEARVTLGADPGTGKQIRRSVYGSTQKEVRQKMTAILRDIDDGTYTDPQRMTVKHWLDEWMTLFCKNKIAPLSYTKYERSIKNHIIPYIGALDLKDVRGFHIQKIYNEMKKKGLAPKTIKDVSGVVHKAFAVAVKQKLIPANPANDAEPPNVPKTKIKPLLDGEIPQFLAAIEDKPMRNAFAACLFLGTREGELLGLSWKSIDFKKGTVHIEQQLQKIDGVYTIIPYAKYEKTRLIKPPAIFFEYLRDEQMRQFKNQLAAGDTWNNPDNLVFTNELGGHYAISTFYKKYKEVVASIGRPDARPHDLRHTAGTVAIAGGADVKSVQGFLGHATASFTLDTYAHVSEMMMNDTSERMQNYYENIAKTTKKEQAE